MQHSKAGLSILFAMGLTLVLSFIGLFLLEYIIPFSRNVKGIENASQAFYESYKGIESSLLDVGIGEIGEDFSNALLADQVDFSYEVIGSGQLIPLVGRGNSVYNPDWNRLSGQDPIQLRIGQGRLGPDDIEMRVRIPDVDRDGNFDETFSGTDSYEEIIFWQLSASDDSLSATSGALISENTIETDNFSYNFWGEDGLRLNRESQEFGEFYTEECGGTNECILRVIVINPLIASGTAKATFPYLEYQIETDEVIPLRYSHIASRGKSFGFTKDLQIATPQQTINQAFDFAVFQ